MKENQDPFPIQCVFSQTKEKKNQRNQNAIKNHFQIPRNIIHTTSGSEESDTAWASMEYSETWKEMFWW